MLLEGISFFVRSINGPNKFRRIKKLIFGNGLIDRLPQNIYSTRTENFEAIFIIPKTIIDSSSCRKDIRNLYLYVGLGDFGEPARQTKIILKIIDRSQAFKCAFG